MLYGEIENKVIVALDTACALGRVTGAYIDSDTYRADYIRTSNSDMPILALADMYSYGDVITVLSDKKMQSEDVCKDMLLYKNGLTVSDVDGNVLGISNELPLSGGKRNRVFFADDKRIQLRSVVSAGKDFIIVNPRYKKIGEKEELPKKAELISDKPAATEVAIPLSAMPTETVGDINFDSVRGGNSRPAVYRKEERMPENDYNFLIGKHVKRDLTDLTRTFLIKSGTVINERVIEYAKKAGKLIELTVNSI